ncbi:hypothetical protein PFICI_08304 [Pestalotiopsis fici W106-1]|uniref:Protein kinase domain-containing protein n=1 Tax=Pestalotiopsis fici (strain W106-1 / CGMCC3.15140) TaxID=1229662 RepID=W3X3Z4_PESFW|nr:uncharacterized protein PFICI_08304 [Pestalotiopsis fici W106-1]ETS80775.1 hypothetical protein PFICI_08304 [Pestalotiopsis fici W106-1]
MTIADKVRDSDRLFHNILKELEVSKTDPAYGIDHSIAVDTWDRFQLWVGNIGADRQDASMLSLESRMTSSSEVLQEISNLLGSLIDTLRDLLDILTSQRKNADNMPEQSREDGIDDSDNDSEVATRDYRADNPSEAQAFLGIVSECITGLFRLSTLVIKATPQDRFSKAQEGRDSFSIHHADIQDVTDLFPKLLRTEYAWLRERLGQANAKRRNFVECCREHQATITEESPKRSGPQGLRFLAISVDIEPTVAKQEPISTEASGSNIDLLQEDDDTSESGDTRTLISAASSTDLEVEQFPQILRLSEVNNGNDTFECPLCCVTGRFADESSWQRHLYQDLRIYVCTADEPECSNRLFSDRKTWFDHELQHHRCQWTCIICQEGPFHAASILRDHATTHHAELEPELVEGLIAASQRPLQVIAASECPFCDEWEELLQSDARNKSTNTSGSVVVELKEFQNHIASHLQNVALLSLAKTSDDYATKDVSGRDEASSQLLHTATIREQAVTVTAESSQARSAKPEGSVDAAMQEATTIIPDSLQRQKQPAPSIASLKQRSVSDFVDLFLFHKQVKQCTRISVFRKHRSFLLMDRLRSWMQEPVESHGHIQISRASSLLEKLYPEREPFEGAYQDYGKHLVSGSKQSLIDILVILLQISTDALLLIDRFYQRQVFDSDIPNIIRYPSNLDDIVQGSIYYKSHDLKNVIGKFMTLAHKITASQNLNLGHGQDVPLGMILPFTVQQSIGHEGKSDVFRVEVPAESMPGYIIEYISYGPSLDTLHARKKRFDKEPLTYELVLKRMEHEEDWKREVEFHRAADGAKGIVKCFGSWKTARRNDHEYYLLLESGWENLEYYFLTYSPPTATTEILDFWTNFRDIAMTLKCMHTLEISSAGTKKTYFGWHGDIKLSNFLLCPYSEGDEMTYVIKLTGFGFAKLEEAIAGDQMEATTPLHGGTEEYGGPERIDPTTGKIDDNKRVTRRFDVWSLGCAIYEAATWIALGAEGIEQFRLLRKIKDNHAQDLNYEDIRGNEEFHLRAKVASVVDIWHGYLLSVLRNQDCITGPVLEIAKRYMLQADPAHRASAEELVNLLDNALAQAHSDAPKYSKQPGLLQTALRLHHQRSQQNSDARASMSATLQFARNVDRTSEEAVDTSQLPSFEYWDAVRFLNGIGLTHSTHIKIPRPTGALPDSEAQRTGPSRKVIRPMTSLSDDRGQDNPHNLTWSQYIESVSNVSQGNHETFRSSAEPHKEQTLQEATFGDMFNDRDIIFLFDDRQRMYVHWPQVQAVATVLMVILPGQGQDGFDTYFSSHRRRPTTKPGGRELDWDFLNQGKGKTYSHKVTLIIFTDGVWRDQQRQLIELAIEKWLRYNKMKGAIDMDPRQYSIQFIHFGNESGSFKALESMGDGLCKGIDVTDVIDVERADGNIHKMIMGSLYDTWHRSRTPTTISTTTTMTDIAPPIPRHLD